MKLADLKVDEEYALCSYGYTGRGRMSQYELANAVKVRLTGTVQRPEHAHGKSRMVTLARVEHLSGRRAGEVVEVPPVRLWVTWAERERLTAESQERERARTDNGATIRKALGILGLHDNRYTIIQPDLARCEVTLSGAELLKLANRAEHLVELEKLTRSYWSGEAIDGQRPDEYLDELLTKLTHWADAHDFSMLDEAGA